MVHLFAGASYYPEGGMEDYQGAFTTVEAAREAFSALREDDRLSLSWAQIAQADAEGKLCVILKWSLRHNLDTKTPADRWMSPQP